MPRHATIRFCALATLAALSAACGARTNDPTYPTSSDYPPPPPAYDPAPVVTTPSVDVTNVVDVTPDVYVDRQYFYEPDDAAHVYWFENSSPQTVYYRPIYRDRDRVYYLERDRNVIRRIYVNDVRARQYSWDRDNRWDAARREQARRNAREEWQRREREDHDWRDRWDRDHRNDRDGRDDRNDRDDRDDRNDRNDRDDGNDRDQRR